MVKLFLECEIHGLTHFDFIVEGKSGRLGCVACFKRTHGICEAAASVLPKPPAIVPQEKSAETIARVMALNFRRWKKSGAPGRWVKKHNGRWTKIDWYELLGILTDSIYWPMDIEKVDMALRSQKRAYRKMPAR